MEIGDEDDALDACEAADSCIQKYARTILERLRKELSSSAVTDNWLLRKLSEDGWWLRAKCAADVMANLSASSDPATWPEPFYIRDIFVWLPEERWGEVPACPTCGSRYRTTRKDRNLSVKKSVKCVTAPTALVCACDAIDCSWCRHAASAD